MKKLIKQQLSKWLWGRLGNRIQDQFRGELSGKLSGKLIDRLYWPVKAMLIERLERELDENHN